MFFDCRCVVLLVGRWQPAIILLATGPGQKRRLFHTTSNRWQFLQQTARLRLVAEISFVLYDSHFLCCLTITSWSNLDFSTGSCSALRLEGKPVCLQTVRCVQRYQRFTCATNVLQSFAGGKMVLLKTDIGVVGKKFLTSCSWTGLLISSPVMGKDLPVYSVQSWTQRRPFSSELTWI